MNRLFSMDSPVTAFLSRVADLVWLNLLTLICCLPIVTAGAAITALHYVTVKMVRGEEGYLTKSYFKSFKQNFRQATGMWILFVFLVVVAIADFRFLPMMNEDVAKILYPVLCAVVFFFFFGAVYWFALLSRFDNTVVNTIKNSCLVGVLNFPRTLLIMAIYGGFIFLYIVLSVRILPLIVMVGISLPVYLAGYLYSAVFKRLEPAEE